MTYSYDYRQASRKTSSEDVLQEHQAVIDRAARKLQTLVGKYDKYQGKQDSIGGTYYGGAAVVTVRSGGLSVLRNVWAFNATVILGLKIGSAWYPMPPEAAHDAKLRSEFYADRSRVIKELRGKADIILLPLIQLLKNAGIHAVYSKPIWGDGSAWSAYFVGMEYRR